MKRLSLTLGLATPDALNDFLEESPFLGGPSAPLVGGALEKLNSTTNQKTHDATIHDLSRIQVSQGLFDMNSDSPGDSSFSNLFDDLKPRHLPPKEKDATTMQKKEGGRNDNKRENKKRKKNPAGARTKDSSTGLLREKEKKMKEENTTNIKNRKISSEVQKLADALEKSAESQQEIHQWDRKMGLKRSHSKTMTQSMQSRKRLRGMLHNISETIKKPS